MRNEQHKEIIKSVCNDFKETPYTAMEVYLKVMDVVKKSGKSRRNIPSYPQVMQILSRANFTVKIDIDGKKSVYVNKSE